jgi:hypothetical protein
MISGYRKCTTRGSGLIEAFNPVVQASPLPWGEGQGEGRFAPFKAPSRIMLALVFLALGISAASAAPRGGSGDPDWPCQQVKVPELSVAAIWPEPLPEKTAESASDVPGLNELIAKLAARKTPMEEAEKDIAAFVTGTPEERKKKADLLFIGLFNALNAQRSQVMNGIERAYRKQKDFAGKIHADTEKLHELQDANADAGKITEQVTQVQWETRIFEDRRKTLTYACEVPVEIDQRIFALARSIQKAGGIS